MDFIAAIVLTILIETLILFLLFRRRFGAWLIIRNSIIANAITLPFVWLFFPVMLASLGWASYTAFSEMFVFFVEAVIYKMLFSKIGWDSALASSAICNVISFIAGLALYHII